MNLKDGFLAQNYQSQGYAFKTKLQYGFMLESRMFKYDKTT